MWGTPLQVKMLGHIGGGTTRAPVFPSQALGSSGLQQGSTRGSAHLDTPAKFVVDLITSSKSCVYHKIVGVSHITVAVILMMT